MISTRTRRGISIAVIVAAQLAGRAGDAMAFSAGDVFWAPGACESPCGVFEITGGGNFGTETLIAETTESPGQMAWSEDSETLYISEFFMNRILSVSSAGSVSTFATGISGPTGLIRLSDGRILASSYRDKIVIDVSAGGDFTSAVPFAQGMPGYGDTSLDSVPVLSPVADVPCLGGVGSAALAIALVGCGLMTPRGIARDGKFPERLPA